MASILNTYLKEEKQLNIALCKIFGIGKNLSKQICDQLGINETLCFNKLTESQIEQISQLLNQNYCVGVELKQNRRKTMQRLIRIASYRGFRHIQGLPTRGQRTHTNARNARHSKMKV
jgi:small subunit ribosomal protein S13